ncbi:acetylglutamate kinase [Methylocystis silviterrae]|uniref:acetylglutamate kinase n=1 Tax=Methylocystis silviterrae TaxID=2743612 RepID=UPI001AEF016F|nr:acetylglutamate kinase [Methylocystis silviterrae]
MNHNIAPMAATAVAIFGSTALAQQAPMTHPTTMAAGMHDAKTDAATAVKMAMRKLWEDHITYTRGYIVSALADLPDTNAVATRLLKNQDDIGDAIKPYYGENAGKKLSTLLRDHILIATEVVKAAKTGDKSGLGSAQKKWSDNGKDIAAFLSGANPNWAKKDVEEMLQKHLDLTTGEVVGRLNKDWAADIKAYDDGHVHMLKFADTLTDGIAKQFPDKFKKEPVL